MDDTGTLEVATEGTLDCVEPLTDRDNADAGDRRIRINWLALPIETSESGDLLAVDGLDPVEEPDDRSDQAEMSCIIALR